MVDSIPKEDLIAMEDPIPMVDHVSTVDSIPMVDPTPMVDPSPMSDIPIVHRTSAFDTGFVEAISSCYSINLLLPHDMQLCPSKTINTIQNRKLY